MTNQTNELNKVVLPNGTEMFLTDAAVVELIESDSFGNSTTAIKNNSTILSSIGSALSTIVALIGLALVMFIVWTMIDSISTSAIAEYNTTFTGVFHIDSSSVFDLFMNNEFGRALELSNAVIGTYYENHTVTELLWTTYAMTSPLTFVMMQSN
jgi:hypothetical protein